VVVALFVFDEYMSYVKPREVADEENSPHGFEEKVFVGDPLKERRSRSRADEQNMSHYILLIIDPISYRTSRLRHYEYELSLRLLIVGKLSSVWIT